MHRRFILVLMLGLIILLLFNTSASSANTGNLQVSFIYVGQGDAYSVFHPLVINGPPPPPPVNGTPPPPAPASGIYYPPPGQTLDEQSQKTPAEVGLKDAIIDDLLDSAKRWALWRHGYLVYVNGGFNSRSEVKSLRKTWHALTVGAAIQQGKIPSYSQAISVFETGLSGKDAIATWKHVISQSSSFDYPGCGDPTDYDPGQMWTYSDLNLFHLNNALAKAYGKVDYSDNYEEVLRQAYFDAIGMQGWSTSIKDDGIRLLFDLEDMGRLGLLMVSRGEWNGQEVIPRWFVEEMDTKQSMGMLVNYSGCNGGTYPGNIGLTQTEFPEAPYGYMTWVNTDSNFYPGADKEWAWGLGAGGFYLLWNKTNGIVYAAVGASESPTSNGIPHVIEANITGDNPLARSPILDR